MPEQQIANFQLRHGTQDKDVFDGVILYNQYRLPDKFPENYIVIDIGANIGAFTVACLLRGAAMVVGFEPGLENFKQLAKNCKDWPEQVVAFHSAVWRSDGDENLVFSQGGGTAAGACYPDEYEDKPGCSVKVPSIGLDTVLEQVTESGGRRVNLLKIDAEYSEYPILYTSKLLHMIDEIVGETHELPMSIPPLGHLDTYCADGMKDFLGKQGFVVEMWPECFSNQTNTIFRAIRKTPEPV